MSGVQLTALTATTALAVKQMQALAQAQMALLKQAAENRRQLVQVLEAAVEAHRIDVRA